jgi:gamma-glutamyltranspeptidase/glutathione hydrolase
LAKHPINLGKATASSEVHPLLEASEEGHNTTHFSVLDSEGMAVSCTITLSASFGAKLMSASTGVILNNAVASFSAAGENQPVGGRRTTSSMSPTLVYLGGELGLVLGSPGGDTIANTVTQVLRNTVDYGMTIDAAVDAPRVHHGFVPDEGRFERAQPISKQAQQALRKFGHTITAKHWSMGDANSILVVGGIAYAYADAREGGLALAVKALARAQPKIQSSANVGSASAR